MALDDIRRRADELLANTGRQVVGSARALAAPSIDPNAAFEAAYAAIPDAAPATPQTSNMLRRIVADPLIGVVKGAAKAAVELPLGAANLVTGGYAGKMAEDLGYDPKAADAFYNPLYSPELKKAQTEVQQAEGFIPTVAAAIKNPSTIVNTVAESAASMLGGMALARFGLKAAAGMGSVIAAGMGEGAVTAMQAAESIRQDDPSKLLSPKQAALALASGGLTAGLGIGGGKVAKKLGILDIDTALAEGKLTTGKAGILKSVIGGAFSEGLLEELPQSAQEQVAQNLALGKPWNEGVAEAAAAGMLAGGFMGGGGNILSSLASDPKGKEKVHDVLTEKVANPDKDIADIIDDITNADILSVLDSENLPSGNLVIPQVGLGTEPINPITGLNMPATELTSGLSDTVNPETGAVRTPETILQEQAAAAALQPDTTKLLPAPGETVEGANIRATREASQRLTAILPILGDTTGGTLKNIANSPHYNKKGKEGTLDRAALDADLKAAGIENGVQGLREMTNPDIQLANEVINEADAWDYGSINIGENTVGATFSNKNQIFPWLASLKSEEIVKVKDPVTGKITKKHKIYDPNPGDVVAALKAFIAGDRQLGANQQILVDTALANHKEKMATLRQSADEKAQLAAQETATERQAMAEPTGDTSFDFGANQSLEDQLREAGATEASIAEMMGRTTPEVAQPDVTPQTPAAEEMTQPAGAPDVLEGAQELDKVAQPIPAKRRLVNVGAVAVDPTKLSEGMRSGIQALALNQGARTNTENLINSPVYDGSFPIAAKGGLEATKKSKKYQDDTAYRAKVDQLEQDMNLEAYNLWNQTRMLRDALATVAPEAGEAMLEQLDTDVTSEYGVDLAGIWHTAAKKTYGDSRLGTIAVRECLQNSLDAVIMAMKKKQIKAGEINIEVDRQTGRLVAEDNGIGMSAEDIAGRFLMLANKTKNELGEGRFGGFGMAKAVILGYTDSNKWKLNTRGFYTDDDITSARGKVQHAAPIQGTRLEVWSADSDGWYAFEDYTLYVRLTEPPKGVTLTLDGEILSPLKMGRSSDQDSRTYDEGDGPVKVDLKAYKSGNTIIPDGYAVIRLVDPVSKAKLVQGISYIGGTEGVLVDITTALTPSMEGYPLTTSRNSLARGEAKEFLQNFVDGRKEDQKDGKDETEVVYKPIDASREWKSAVARFKKSPFYSKLQGILKPFSAGVDTKDWRAAYEPEGDQWAIEDGKGNVIDAGFASRRDAELQIAGTKLTIGTAYVNPDKWAVRSQKGAKLNNGTPEMLQVLAVYEAMIRLKGMEAGIPTRELQIMDYAEDVTYLATYHTGNHQIGFNLRLFDYSLIQNPVMAEAMLHAVANHELTHFYADGHDKHFASSEIKVAKDSANRAHQDAFAAMADLLAGKDTLPLFEKMDAAPGAETALDITIKESEKVMTEIYTEEQYELFNADQGIDLIYPLDDTDQLSLFGDTAGDADLAATQDRTGTKEPSGQGDNAGADAGVRSGSGEQATAQNIEVSKDADFTMNGEYYMTMPDGTIYQLSYDKQSQMWFYEQNKSRHFAEPGAGWFVGANKTDIMQQLAAEHNAGTLRDPKIYSALPEGSKTVKNFLPKQDTSVQLNDITSVIPLALKELAKLGKASKEAMPHLESIAKEIYAAGVKSYGDFRTKMQAALGNLWAEFKDQMRYLWSVVEQEAADIKAGLKEITGAKKPLVGEVRWSKSKADKNLIEGAKEISKDLKALAGQKPNVATKPFSPTKDSAKIAEVMSAKLGVTIKPEELSFLEDVELTKLVAPFGASVSVVSYSGKETIPDGFVIPGQYGNRIFVNKTATHPAIAILGHELTHQMAVNAPELYQELLDYIKANTNDAALKDYTSWLQTKPAYEGVSQAELEQEVVGNIAGSQFNKKSFWEKMAARSPELFGKMIAYVKDFYTSVSQFLKGAENTVRDVKSVEEKVSEVFDKYARLYAAGKFPVSVEGGMTVQALMPDKITDTLNTLGKQVMNPGATLSTTNLGTMFDRAVAFFMPKNRMFDFYRDRKALRQFVPEIDEIARRVERQTATQNGLMEEAGLVVNKVFDAIGAPVTLGGKEIYYKADEAKAQAFQELMGMAREWMMVADQDADHQDVQADTWAKLGMEAKTGLTWEEAHAKVYNAFNRMTPEMQAAYKSVRELNQRAYDAQKKMNIDLYRNNPNLSDEKKAALIKKVEKMYSDRKGDYFTLGRSGEYVLEVKVADEVDEEGNITKRGQRLFSTAFESKADWLAAEKEFGANPEKALAQHSHFSKEYIDSLGDLEVSTKYRPPVTRQTANIPLSFVEKLTALVGTATMIDFRKEVRGIQRDLTKQIKKGDVAVPDGITEKLTELAKAQTIQDAARIQKELQKMADQIKLDEQFLKDTEAAIDGMGYSEAVANNLKDSFHQQWLQHLPETSIMKHFIRSKNMAGYSENMMRSFAQYHQKHSRAVAFIRHGSKINELLGEMDKKGAKADSPEATAAVGEFTRMMRDHQTATMGERVNPMVRHLTKIPFIWYLSSPSTMLVQSSQPFTITVPFLGARFGFSKSLGAVSQSYKRQMRGEFKNTKLLEFAEKHRTLIDNLNAELDSGAAGYEKRINELTKGMEKKDLEFLGMILTPGLSIGITHETMQFAQDGETTRTGVMNKLGFFMELAETSSRKAAFAAAFGLKYQDTGDFAASLKLADRAISDTLYDYSAPNRPQVLSGNFGRLFGQFRIYQIQTAFKIMKLGIDAINNSNLTAAEQKQARQELAMLLGMNFAVAGAVGLPGMSMAMGLATVLYAMFGGDDEPWDAEIEFAKIFRNMPGGETLHKGLPTLLGMDISRRVGAGGVFDILQNRPPESKKGADLAAWYALQLAGPTYSTLVTNPITAYEAYQKGDFGDALKIGAPGPIKSLAKAYKLAQEGVKTGSGQTVIAPEDISPWQMMLMGVGLNPLEMSLKSEEQKLEATYSTQITERRAKLESDLAKAVIEGDQADIDEAVNAVAKFNTSVPLFALKGSELATGVKDAMYKDLGVKSKKQRKLEFAYGGANESE